ncbi:PDZ domain-containing protein [Streptomyces sp. NPDC059215]|uniref:PDZ domain-containing protein n=1 Tax=Streptomyces sp. NPDC059215 TaxID=3346772 RepID=UPI0036C2CE1D
MEQTALRPKPMPGQEPGAGDSRPAPAARRPHAVRRRGRRLMSLLFGLLVGTVLVLSGVGLGTVGATVIGMSRMAALQREAGDAGAGRGPDRARGQEGKQAQDGKQAHGGRQGPASGTEDASGSSPSASSRGGTGTGTRAALGVEAVDAPGGAGALITAVHDPGPGRTAGLVRGDVLDALGGTRLGSAADLARAVAAADPGRAVTLAVRHADGGRQLLTAVPGLVT